MLDLQQRIVRTWFFPPYSLLEAAIHSLQNLPWTDVCCWLYLARLACATATCQLDVLLLLSRVPSGNAYRRLADNMFHTENSCVLVVRQHC